MSGEKVVLGQIGEHVEPEACRACGKSPTACGRSREFCCGPCAESRFDTHTPTPVPSEVAETTAGEREGVTWADMRAARLAAWESETCPRGDITPAEPDAGEVEALAKVLADHAQRNGGPCACGHHPIGEPGWHRRHVATHLAALLDRVRREEGAKAWEAGHRHRQRRGPDECQCGAYYDGECGCGKYGSGPLVSLDDNPYRAASVARDPA